MIIKGSLVRVVYKYLWGTDFRGTFIVVGMREGYYHVHRSDGINNHLLPATILKTDVEMCIDCDKCQYRFMCYTNEIGFIVKGDEDAEVGS